MNKTFWLVHKKKKKQINKRKKKKKERKKKKKIHLNLHIKKIYELFH